jgi:hypothetical protein
MASPAEVKSGTGRTGTKWGSDEIGSLEGVVDLVSSGPAVPVHAHFGDLFVFGLAEERPSDVHPFAGPAPPEDAFELYGKPGSDGEDLSRSEGAFRLVVGDVSPIGAYGLPAFEGISEGAFSKNGAVTEDRQEHLGVLASPGAAERVDQASGGGGMIR